MTFYLKETFRIFRRSSIAAIVTITITTIAVFLTSLSIFLIFISQDFSDRIKQNIEINLYLNDTLTKNEIERTQNLIEEKSFISSVKYISKENAAKDFIKETGEDFRAVLDYNPLPNSFVVNFKSGSVNEKNFETLVSDLKSIPGISDVVYDFNVVVRILKILRSLELAIYIASFLLILLSVYLVYSEFVNVLVQKPTAVRLLPIEPPSGEEAKIVDYIFEPSAEAVLAELLPRYVENSIFHALLESKASEHSARMTAMDSATKNAEEMIQKLTLTMNRVRQATITKELSEIVGGAAALE